jgi:CubicO group peptidase (beta-lactamase class C family)
VNTKFEIGSMTKQFTAVLVPQFVNEGKLRLDGHLSDYLPCYRKDTGKKITISELLSHTSGIPSFTDLPGFLDGPASRVHHTVREFVRDFCSGELQFEPGTKFEYSNSGYFLLGAVLEQASGATYERLLHDRIFEPLAMKDSGYTRTDTVIDHRAGYEHSPSGLQNARYYDMVSALEAFNAWVKRLEIASDIDVGNFVAFLRPLEQRHTFFHESGCPLSDHGLDYCYANPCPETGAAAIFDKVRSGITASPDEDDEFGSFMMLF